jgi:acetyl-CoA carboxylase biotin carboxyl carrier protein
MKLTNEDVQEILDLLEATQFDVLHLQTERFKLTLRRHQSAGDQSVSEWSQESESLATPQILQPEYTSPRGGDPSLSQARSTTSVTTPQGVSAIDDDPTTIAIRTSLPGTFYRAPRPGDPAFVEIGSIVREDTVIGIIETMKLMNAVHAGASGTIAEILIPNAHFAEQGSILMRIKPDPS